MKRNALVIGVVLFWFASFAIAAEQKEYPAPQSQQTEQQANVARNDANVRMHADGNNTCECVPTHGKQSDSKDKQGDPEGDPQASQNQVEYGGGG